MSKPELQGLPVRVTPNARKEAIEESPDGTLKIRLRAPAVEGKANAALVEFLAARLQVSRRAISIRSGEHSRNKIVQIDQLSPEEARQRLLHP